MKELFAEILASMRTSKLRTFLTSFTIAWGIIILVVLLGIGTGIRNGATRMSEDMGMSHFGTQVTLQETNLPYAGYQKGRKPKLTADQIDRLMSIFADDLYGIDPAPDFAFLTFTTDFGSVGTQLGTATPLSERFRTLRVIQGRTFSPRELATGERVALLCKSTISKLFEAGTDPIGQVITAGGVSYRIIGVTEDVNPFFAITEIPLTTYQGLYPNQMIEVSNLKLYPKGSKAEEMKSFEERFKGELSKMLKFDPNDPYVFRLQSSTDVKNSMDKAFNGLDMLLWIMGLGSLAVGSIGVSTIMTVTVRERMREIGIRKALGARPRDILRMILGESIALSVVSGLVGLLLGAGIVRLIGYSAEHDSWAIQEVGNGNGAEAAYYHIVSDPSVNLSIAIGALIVLVIVGIIAGIRPARHALHVPAVIAMRDK